jgi:DNA-binding NarL/FixJ family response regulator
VRGPGAVESVVLPGNGHVRGSVLVVDDERTIADLVARYLEHAGYAALVARDGERALELAGEERPDLIVLDLMLPRIDGLEVMRRLRQRSEREHHRPPAVILLTAKGEETDRVVGLRLGADDYVVKPFAPAELVDRVHAVIARAEPQTKRRVLTAREHEILGLLASGLAQGAIAEQLRISPRTVATHIERILAKLGVRSRAQAVALAYRDALVPAP